MSYYLIIRGPLGSGKSTISKALAAQSQAEHISMDRILDDYNLTHEKEEGYISQKSFQKANTIAVKQALPLLKSGKPVIFDGNFYWKSQIDDLISQLSYAHEIFTLKVPLEVCILRDRERGRTHGEDAARAVYKQSTSFEIGIALDATRPLQSIVKDILKYCKKLKAKERIAKY